MRLAILICLLAIPALASEPSGPVCEYPEGTVIREWITQHTEYTYPDGQYHLLVQRYPAVCAPPPTTCRCDCDGNGAVGVSDYAILTSEWGMVCEARDE